METPIDDAMRDEVDAGARSFSAAVPALLEVADAVTEPMQAPAKPARPIPPNAGKGRPKGSRNRANVELGAMVDKALAEAGGWRYLVQQAKDNPTAFLALVARRLPREVKAEISAELTVRQETRRELIERSVALMLAIERGGLQRAAEAQRIKAPERKRETEDARTARALPADGVGAKASAHAQPLALHGPAARVLPTQ